MAVSIYKLNENNQAEELIPAEYNKELELQEIVARNPELLLKNTDENLQIMLIKSELPLGGENGESEISLDHLFVDSDGILILVEDKRRTDTRINREVAGQLVDYASCLANYDVAILRSYFCENNSEEIQNEYGTEEFWDKVATNLRAGNIKLVFVADKMPSSLKRIVVFLDRNFSTINVYGVEISRYKKGDSFYLTTNIIESTATERKINVVHQEWDDTSMTEQIRRFLDGNALKVYKNACQFFAKKGCELSYGKGKRYASLNIKYDERFLTQLNVNENWLAFDFRGNISQNDFEPLKNSIEKEINFKKEVFSQTAKSVIFHVEDYPADFIDEKLELIFESIIKTEEGKSELC